jgi:NADP-dependent 3-hydroxy acid dehydrogenase YdfG
MRQPDLSGQAVAITGASSGIGAALALACAQAGASVALGARRVERLQALREQIGQAGGHVETMRMDVGVEQEARRFVDFAHQRLGRLDVLVNNAGVMLLGPVEGAPTAEWRQMIDVNVMGLLHCTHAAIPLMRAQGGGHIVNLSSTAGRVATAGAAVYNLTKFGVGAFSEALRQELVPHGIRVTLIEPGRTDTELATHNRPEVLDVVSTRYEGIAPLQAQDVAAAILYAIGQPAHVSVNEILVRPSTQRF